MESLGLDFAQQDDTEYDEFEDHPEREWIVQKITYEGLEEEEAGFHGGGKIEGTT